MKNFIRTACTLVFFHCVGAYPVFAQVYKIDVRNISGHDLAGELITVDRSNFSADALAKLDSSFGVFDGTSILKSQWIPATSGSGPAFVFIAPGIDPGQVKSLEIKHGPNGNSASVAAAKYVLPRMDVAWENDRTAHRIYGGPLAGDVRDGIDVWVKRVRYPVIDKWYDGDSLKGKKRVSYHVDHGEGADYFEVKKSLGAGGSGLWSNGTLRHFGLFRSQQIIAPGPLEAKFIVNYDSTFEHSPKISCSRTFTLDAGSNLTKIDLSLESSDPADSVIAIGLVKREFVQRDVDSANGILSLWGLVDKDSSHGELGIAVLAPAGSVVGFAEDASHYYLIARLGPQHSLSYYTGAGWNKSGDFAGRDTWNSYLSDYRKPKYTITAH